jgi:hypothetical protein
MGKIKKEIINSLGTYIDDKIPLGQPWESLDGMAIKLALNTLNNRFGPMIPDELTPKIEELITAVVAENWDQVEVTVAIALAEIITTPLIDGTEEEIAAYTLIIQSISTLIQGWLKK